MLLSVTLSDAWKLSIINNDPCQYRVATRKCNFISTREFFFQELPSYRIRNLIFSLGNDPWYIPGIKPSISIPQDPDFSKSFSVPLARPDDSYWGAIFVSHFFSPTPEVRVEAAGPPARAATFRKRMKRLTRRHADGDGSWKPIRSFQRWLVVHFPILHVCIRRESTRQERTEAFSR